MEEQNKTDPNDFSEEFLSLWRSYRKYQNILIVLAVIVFGGFFLKIFPAKAMWILTIPAIVWNSYFYFKLRCPKCDNLLLFLGKDIFLVGKNCPSCGAILKKQGLNYPIHPWIPWKEKTTPEKTIIITIFAVIAMLIGLAIIKGVKVKFEHIEVPKSNCR